MTDFPNLPFEAETDNHGYQIPDPGSEDWHVPINDNFEAFETDIEVRDEFSNLSEYEPHDGAKFLATDTGAAYVGDGSDWNWLRSTGGSPTLNGLNVDNNDPLGIGRLDPDVPLDILGQNNWKLTESDGDVRIGDEDHRLAIGVSLGGAGRGTSRLYAKGGVEQLRLGTSGGHSMIVEEEMVTFVEPLLFNVDANEPMAYLYEGGTSNPEQAIVTHSPDFPDWGLFYNDEDDEFIFRNADMTTQGTASKNFVQQVDTDDGEKEVVYTTVESGTPHTEASGVVDLEDGRAEVDLPDHFSWVTSDEDPLMAQVTAHTGEPVRPQVTERSTHRIVVEDVEDPTASYEVSYTVKGTREGHEDPEVVREPRVSTSTGGE